MTKNVNPFIEDGYLLPNASLNKLKIINLDNIEMNHNLKGSTAIELVSADTFNKSISKFLEDIKLSKTNDIFSDFELCLNSEKREIRYDAENIIKNFARNLGYVLIALKQGNNQGRDARPDWDASNWKFWSNIEKIILSGGLLSGIIGNKLVHYTEAFFKKKSFIPYSLEIAKDPNILSLIGASKISSSNSPNSMVFDFGHSYIKRGYIESNSKFNSLYQLEKIESRYIQWEYEESQQELIDAKKLNDYIVKVIIDSYNYLSKIKANISETIIISVANYVNNGAMSKRGGYGKLSLLSHNYEKYISNQLSSILDKQMIVCFVHDGTAGAIAVQHNYSDNISVISLETFP